MLVSIHQPNYLPRPKVIDKLLAVDLVVILDDVQYVSREWQNRALVMHSPGHLRWLTVPIYSKGKSTQLIKDCEIVNDSNWHHKHVETIRSFYHKSRWISSFEEYVAPLWEEQSTELAPLCIASTRRLLSAIGRQAEFVYSQDLTNEEFSRSLPEALNKSVVACPGSIAVKPEQLHRNIRTTARLVDICRSVGATGYLTGSGGLSYLVPDLFRYAGIKLYLQCDKVSDRATWKSLSLIDSLLVRGPSETQNSLLKGTYGELSS